MDKVLELGERPHLRVERVRRDLRVEGHDSQEVQLRAGSDTTEVEQKDGATIIRAPASLRLRVPTDCILEIGHVGGDLAMSNLSSDCHIGQIGGDVRFEEVGGLLVDRIGGDCLASQIEGDISLKAVGGDVVLDKLDGSVKVLGAGGDVVLAKVKGGIQVAVGGDATVNLKSGIADRVDISSGGDVYCRLPSEASIAAKLMAGGDLWLAIGEADEVPVEMMDLGGTIAAKVGEKIADMEAALSAMGAELNGVSSELISDRVHKIVDRAVRRQEQVEARSSLHEALQQGFARGKGASDEERMKVLKLLEEKKITVEQAEELLGALED